jgi:hypothetical protein
MSGRISYAKARADFEYLESLAELVDQVELDAEREGLMRDPTKARAARMYADGISLWFYEHRGRFSDDKRVQAISERYS